MKTSTLNAVWNVTKRICQLRGKILRRIELTLAQHLTIILRRRDLTCRFTWNWQLGCFYETFEGGTATVIYLLAFRGGDNFIAYINDFYAESEAFIGTSSNCVRVAVKCRKQHFCYVRSVLRPVTVCKPQTCNKITTSTSIGWHSTRISIVVLIQKRIT